MQAAEFSFANTPGPPACTSGQACEPDFMVAGGASVNVRLRCVPANTGNRATTLRVTSDADNATGNDQVNVVCQGTSSMISVDQTSLAFPPTRVGQTAPTQTIRITNTASTDTTVLTYTLALPADFTASPPCATTCTLAPGDHRDHTITFSPTQAGARGGDLVISNNDFNDNPVRIPLTGTGTEPVITLELPAPPPLNLGNVAVGDTSNPGTIRIRNTGSAPLRIASVALNPMNTPDFTILTGPTGVTLVDPGDPAIWTVSCTPTSHGPKSASLQISNDSSVTPFSVGLTCVGQQAVLSAPSPLDFGTVAQNTTANRTLVVTNTGNIAAQISALPISNTTFSVDETPPINVPANGSTTLHLHFRPPNGDMQSGSITIENDGRTDPVVALLGDGLTTGVDVSPNPARFGDVRIDTPQTMQIHVENGAEATIHVTGITVSNTTDFRIVGPTVFQVPGNGGDVAFTVEARPHAIGMQDGTIRLTMTELPEGRSVPVSAIGVAPDIRVETNDAVKNDGILEIGGVDVDLGAATGVITVFNEGTGDLHVTGCSVVGDPALGVAPTTSCDFHVGMGASKNIEVTFNPTLEGRAEGTLTVVSNTIDNAERTIRISLNGVGLDRHLGLSSHSLDFPPTFRYPVEPSRQTLRITNTPAPGATPGAPLHLTMITSTDAYTVVGEPSRTLDGGAMVDLVVEFRPTMVGVYDGTLTIMNDDDAEPMAIVDLNGMGISRTVAVSPLSVDIGRIGVGIPVSLAEIGQLIRLSNSSRTAAFRLKSVTPQPVDGTPPGAAHITTPSDVEIAAGASVDLDAEIVGDRAGPISFDLLIYLDEDPDPHAMVHLTAEVVDVHFHGGGCRAVDGAAPGAALVLLALAWGLRRRRAAAALLTLSLALAPAAARADGDVNLTTFSPAPATEPSMVQVESADVGPSGAWSLGVALDYAVNPLQISERRADGSLLMNESPVTGRAGADLAFAYAIGGRLDLGVRLPIVQQTAGAVTLPGIGASDGAGIGDVALHGKLQLLDQRHLAFALALTGTAPTATSGHFAGTGGWAGELRGIVGLRSGRLGIGINGGFLARPTARLGDIEQTNQLHYGVGASWRASRRLWAIGETFGNADLGGAGSASLEWLLGARWRPATAVSFACGFGAGIVDGIGAPDLRGFLQLAFTPGARPVEPLIGGRVLTKRDLGDDDGDGISNIDDKCPADAEDKDGFEDGDGCREPDNDKDGIPDAFDGCVNGAEDDDGFQDDDGCPDDDNDGDGIADAADLCASEPEDKDGFADQDGCPEPDNDSDGIADVTDKCPLEAEVINGKDDDDGCADPGDSAVMPMPDRIELLEPIMFAPNTAKINKKSFNVLGQVAATLRAHKEIVRLRVTVHVHPRNSRDQDLSDRRAEAVAAWLVQWGIEASRIDARGFGSTKPLVPKTQKGAEQVNDRVELVVLERN